jgi:hypothetical protein
LVWNYPLETSTGFFGRRGSVIGKREFEPDMITVEREVAKLKLLRETCINQRAIEGEGNFTTGY